MQIHLIESFFTGSHSQWARQLKAKSGHEIHLIQLPGRFWKWRMQASAAVLADKSNQLDMPDAYLCTDMTNVAEFRAFLSEERRSLPIYLYMHENQITYPWSAQDEDISKERDHTYGLINFKSCINAERIFFNSLYHKTSFLESLPDFLHRFPDRTLQAYLSVIEQKSEVLPIGLELPDAYTQRQKAFEPPVILWNHRWEYDKGANEFFNILFKIKENGINFRLIVCGEKGRISPEIFKEAHNRLSEEILHWGYADDRNMYLSLLERADVLPVCSYQDFFGISVVEAIAHGVFPLLPDRLAYPEHIPPTLHKEHLYQTSEDLIQRLSTYLLRPKSISKELLSAVSKYSWNKIISQYDQAFIQKK